MPINCPKIELFPSILKSLGLNQGFLSTFELNPFEGKVASTSPQFTATITQNDKTITFAVSAKNRSIPKYVDTAILEAKWNAIELELLPMVVVPYFNEQQLDALEANKVSGIDLCGNFVIAVNDTIYMRRSGKPNQYKDSAPTRFVYKGATSLVPRVFLCQPTFESVAEIQTAIIARGCKIAMSTVSKAIKKMEEDLIITRSNSLISLLQADTLFIKLQNSFVTPTTSSERNFKSSLTIAELCKKSNKLVVSGTSSYSQYCAGLRGDKPIMYCPNLKELQSTLENQIEEVDRFDDFTIKEIKDKTPFFDARRKNDGTLYASPIQAYLELSIGDKRDQQLAEQMKKNILTSLPIL
ncbi:hypothetical protein H8D29_01310 [PVC group bacterium]|nr:hypothetical protein [PVC group bacterium]